MDTLFRFGHNIFSVSISPCSRLNFFLLRDIYVQQLDYNNIMCAKSMKVHSIELKIMRAHFTINSKVKHLTEFTPHNNDNEEYEYSNNGTRHKTLLIHPMIINRIYG